MHVMLYKRHLKGCPHRPKRDYKRCDCPIWLTWNCAGKQFRQTSNTSTWETAQKKARRIEQRYEDAELGVKSGPSAPASVEQAIKLFLDGKRGENLSPNTLSKHKLTMSRLQKHCDREGLMFIRDLTLSHLTSWRATWPFKSPIAKRNNQERVRAFFRFCYQDGLIPDNPAAKLSPIKLKADENMQTQPFEPAEMSAILESIPKCGFTAKQADRVRGLMLLQRWSGLAIQDAVCLARAQLKPAGEHYRVITKRSKTGVAINNVIPGRVGQELLKVLNGNPRYFFWTGTGKPKSAVSYFQKLLQLVFDKAGIKSGHSHRFRDTAAVELLKAGVDIRKVSKFLGHTSVLITERYYAPWNSAQQEILDDDVSAAWMKMGR